MDGENNGKPYFLMDDLGGFPIFLVQHPYVSSSLGVGKSSKIKDKSYMFFLLMLAYVIKIKRSPHFF